MKGKRGKHVKLTKEERARRKARNLARKRVPSAVRWEKAHVRHQSVLEQARERMPERKSRRKKMEEKVAEALAQLPGVEEARAPEAERL